MAYVQGDDLRQRLRVELHAWYSQDSLRFTYSVSELSRRAGVSRTTLHKPEFVRFVAECLRELPAATTVLRRGEAELRAEHERLRFRNAELQGRLDALYRQFGELYGRLHASSCDLRAVIEPTAQAISAEAGACVLCGASLHQSFDGE